jgi:hypothetical protein
VIRLAESRSEEDNAPIHPTVPLQVLRSLIPSKHGVVASGLLLHGLEEWNSSRDAALR